MLPKLLKMLLHPGRIIPRLRSAWRERVVRVMDAGKWYYRYKGRLYPEHLRSSSAGWISGKALKFCAGRGIDVGDAGWSLQGAIAVRNVPQPEIYRLGDFPDGSLDFVFSSHYLGRLDRWPEALACWAVKLRPGGHMFLYLPHESMELWRPGAPWSEASQKWIPTAEAVEDLLRINGLTVVERGPERDDFWSFYLAARKD